MSRTVVVVTDGYVGVEAQAFRFIREHLAEANLFAFGIGSSVNRGLIEGMARAGQGEPFVVLRPDKAAAEAEKLRAYIEQPVLAGVNVAFYGLRRLRRRAPEAARPDGAPAAGAVRQVPRQRPAGASRSRGTSGRRPAAAGRSTSARPTCAPRTRRCAGCGRASWVETLDDERAMGAGKPAEEAITALGLDYSLLTAFTSFVAIDSQVVNARRRRARTCASRCRCPRGCRTSRLATREPWA